MGIYINGMANISPQDTFANEDLVKGIREYSRYLTCVEPNYREYIEPKLLRRMSRIIKMGVACAKTSLAEAHVDQPDAILTGTGMGCLLDTEKFLNKMFDNQEQFLNPTAFIQSTHNTVGAQIGLMLKCYRENFTFVHQNTSFESAMQHSMLLLHQGKANNVLVGGIDEITEENYMLKTHVDYWKKEDVKNTGLYQTNTPGTLPGEGSAFFVVSHKEQSSTYAQVKALETVYKLDGHEGLENKVKDILQANEMGVDELDLVFLGNNGDVHDDALYNRLMEGLLKNTPYAFYKHLCGEYYTASSFAFWLASNILRTQSLPDFVEPSKPHPPAINNILLYDQNYNRNHSLMLLSRCRSHM